MNRRKGSNRDSLAVEQAIEKSWFVYLLRCADGSLYTGITNDVVRRCAQHNAGTASRYTRARLPVEVVYEEGQPSHGAALRRELAIKAMPRKQKELLVAAFDERPKRRH